MTYSRRPAWLLGVAGAFCALAAAPAVRAQTMTLAPVTFSGGLYHYTYTVTNTSASDLYVLTLYVAPGVGVLQNIVAPTGITPQYDTGLGLLGLSEDTAVFSAVPLSLTFDSALAPRPSQYDASLVDLTTGGTSVVSAGVQAPQVPEPGTLALALLAGPGLLLIARRRRASLTSDRTTQGDHTV